MENKKLHFLGDTGIKIWSINWGISCRNKDDVILQVEDNYLAQEEDRYSKDVFLEDGMGLEVSLKIKDEKEGVLRLESCLENTGSIDLSLASFSPLMARGISSHADNVVFFRQGWQSWSFSGVLKNGEKDRNPRTRWARILSIDVKNPSPGKRGQYTSDMFALLEDKKEKKALLLGALEAKEHFTAIKYHQPTLFRSHPLLIAQFFLDDIVLKQGEKIALEPLVILWGEGTKILEDYARMVGLAMDKRVPAKNKAGWTSRYAYSENVEEADILKNLGQLSQAKKEYPVDVVHTDNGYQEKIGDWLYFNSKFPGGGGGLARKIMRRGFIPGIWLAPFVAEAGSRIFSDHPEWFLQNKKGYPIRAALKPGWGYNRKVYALDPTNPGFQEYLEEVITIMVHSWGYKYLTLDLLYAGALPGERFDPSKTRAQALRQGLELIRKAAGQEAFIVGSASPLGPAIGLVDAMRMAVDVTPSWETFRSRWLGCGLYLPSTRNAIRNMLARNFLHSQWWYNHPDCLLLEGSRGLNEDETRSLATVVAFSRGLIFISNPLEEISAAGQEMLKQVSKISQEISHKPVKVLDLLSRRDPELALAEGDDNYYLAVFNMLGKDRQRNINLKEIISRPYWPAHLVEFWTREAFFIEEGVLKIHKIAPHGVKLFRISKV